uniref:Uncharacterized protein n=1 Tax=Picea sitchensis TaxID=3332 RepID=D5ABA8_PICSI|nr:unknown [Picea sitchensis]
MTALQLHLLCEYRHELHVVDDQPGCNLLKVSNQTVQCILPYLNGLMKMLTFALKVGAHVVAGMGEMIPDLSKEVAQLEESSLGANIVAGMGEMIPYLSTEVAKLGESPSLSAGAVAINSDVNQFRTAQQWLVDFLKSQGCLNGKAIAQKFGLWRVRYTDDGQIAWVCNRHKASGIRNNEVMEIPID